MDKERRMRMPVIGGSSLLVIFAVLCLTVFALLALSTVQAGGRLSQASAQAVSDYYRAACQAEEIFARLRLGQMPDGVEKNADVYSYVCPVSDTQQLRVELRCEAGSWTVLRWQTESIAAWETDETLGVWDGT